MATIDELKAQIDNLRIQLANQLYENDFLLHRRNKQIGFGFMGPYVPCPTCPAGIAQPAEGARRFGFMRSPTSHTLPSRVPAEDARFGFAAPYPASPGTPTPSDVEYGFTAMGHPLAPSAGYPLAPEYPYYGHPRMIQRYGFMAFPEAAVIKEYGKPQKFERYGFMSKDYISKRFFE